MLNFKITYGPVNGQARLETIRSVDGNLTRAEREHRLRNSMLLTLNLGEEIKRIEPVVQTIKVQPY